VCRGHEFYNPIGFLSVKQKLPASAGMAQDPGSTTCDVNHSSRIFDGSAFCTVTGV
jgi:hypothetical protein